MVGVEGWTTVKGNNNPSSVQLSADIGKGVVGSDTNGESWYFLAPGDKFSGDLSGAYNGRLALTLVHAETPSTGSVRREPDVILEASCGHSLMLYNYASKSGDLSVMLNEDAGWIDSRTKSAPGAMDFLGVLSHLSAVKVRGGFYAGAESTRLSSVTITAGKAWFPCCTLDGTVDLCQKKPSSYYNPTGLKFYCEGHMYKPVKVTRVLPRFGRRTGGSIVTVIGENFGLSGSNPIVRINGRACQRTYYAPSTTIDQSMYPTYSADGTVENEVANMYALKGTGMRVVGASSPAGNALINAYNSATDSMKQQYPEHCWNGMQDDGSDKGFNYGTAAAAKYINQGETGIDTGGPCFPEHCSSCVKPSAVSVASNFLNKGAKGDTQHLRCSTGNQIAAKGSDTCKGRGSDTALCNAMFPYVGYPALCPEDAPYSSRLKRSYTATHYPTATGFGWNLEWADIRRDYGHRRWNKYGMFASVNSKKEPVEGVTHVTHANPQLGTTEFGQTTVMAGSGLKQGGTALRVNGACEVLFGKGVTTATGQSKSVSCGSDSAMTVTAYTDHDANADGVFDFCELTLDANTVEAGGLAPNAPGSGTTPESNCGPGATVSFAAYAGGSFDESGISRSKFVHVDDAVALCGLNFKPLGPRAADDAMTPDADHYTVDTLDLDDRVQGVTTVNQAPPLADTNTALVVKDPFALLGEVGTLAAAAYVQCGDAILKVTAAVAADETTDPGKLTIENPGAAVPLCHQGATVKRLWLIQLLEKPDDKADEYFHATTDRDSFGTPTFANPAYVMLYTNGNEEVNGEIVKVVGVKSFTGGTLEKTLFVSARGQFGSPVTKHVKGTTKEVVAVEVCRGAAVSLGPAAATGGNHFTAAISANAECQAYDGPTATDGRACRLRVDAATQLLNAVHVGDVARRVAQGRTKAAAQLVDSGTSLTVDSAAALMAAPGEVVENFFVSCGNDVTLKVTAVDYATNVLTVAGASALGDNTGTVGRCNSGDVVTVVKGVAELKADPATATAIIVLGRCEDLLGGRPVQQSNNGAAAAGAVDYDVSDRTLTVSCGSDNVAVQEVTSYSLEDNECTLKVAATSASCAKATAGFVYNSLHGTFPANQEYTTTFDVLSTAELASSDVNEFSHFRYIKVDNEIMRIVDLADGDTAEMTKGYERLTVARAQLGTLAAPHDRDATVTLLPRMTELSQGITASAAKLFLPSHADIISNNLNVAGVGSGLQVGGSKTAYYIKVDDEIMKIVGSVSVVLDANAKDDDGAELTVLRAQKGTLATAHAAGATITVLGCMDGDETGNNCGGSCKPCSAPAKGGPVQQEKLLCVTPAGHSGAGAAGQGAGDLAVTVEASPGPKASPFRARMAPGATGWLDQASTAESCISEQNRGFQYGAHDFVWGVHFASAAQAEEVKVTDMAVDHNTGETYMVGTMMGALTLQGKHIAMNAKMLGKLRVDKKSGVKVALTGLGLSEDSTSATVIKLVQNKAFTGDGDLVGAKVVVTNTGDDARKGYGCMGTVTASDATGTAAKPELTVDGFARAHGGGACDIDLAMAAATVTVYNGKMSFIAKLSKDGRPVWLNKLDAESDIDTVMGQVVITCTIDLN